MSKKEIFEKEINNKKGILISEFINTGKKVRVKCSNSHEFEINYLDLILNKKWCTDCELLENNDKNDLSMILQDLGYKYEKNPKNNNNIHFDYLVLDEEKKIYIDIDNIEDIETDEYLFDLIKKLNYTRNDKLIKLVKENFTHEEIESFLISSFLEDEKFLFNHEKHNEIGDRMRNFIKQNKNNKINSNDGINENNKINSNDGINENKNNNEYYFGYIDCINSDEYISEEEQIREFKKFCNEKSISLKKLFIESQISSIQERRVLKKLLRTLRSNDHVIIFSINQISKNLEEQNWFKNEIKNKTQASLIIIHDFKIEERNFDTLSDKISYFMNKKSSKKVLKTKPRYGFISSGRRKPFVENEREQFIIERIRQLRKELPMPTLTMIAKTLDSENLEYKPGKKWHLQRLSVIMEQNNIDKCLSFNYDGRI